MGIVFSSDGGNSFSPYYTAKDLYGIFLFLIFFAFFLFFAPNSLGHPDNYIQANPMVTPPHIVPEWYFLPFFAILRSIPDKLSGVLALAGAILSLFILPFIHFPQVRSHRWRPVSKVTFWYFVISCLFLGWLGASPIEFPYFQLSQFVTVCFFAYFYIIAPLIIKFEYWLWRARFSKYLNRYRYGRYLEVI